MVPRSWSVRAGARRKQLALIFVAVMVASPMAVADFRTPGPSPAAVARQLDVANAASDCFSGTPTRTFDIVAINTTIVYNNFGDHDPFGRMYVLADQEQAVRDAVNANPRTPSDLVTPLVIRAHLGDCVEVHFTNKIADAGPLPNLVSQGLDELAVTGTAQFVLDTVKAFGGPDPGVGGNPLTGFTDLVPDTPSVERASIHIHKALTAVTSQGSAVGRNPDSTVGKGESITYRWYLPDDPTWEGTYLFHSHADPRFQAAHGLFGALIAEPKGYDWLHPTTGAPLASGWEAMIVHPSGPGKAGNPDFREAVTVFHDQVEPCRKESQARTCLAIPNVDDNRISAAYGPGTKAINYRSEPFMNRFNYVRLNISEPGLLPHYGNGTSDFENAPFDESQAYGSYGYGDPATPIARAYVGDPTKFRLVHGGPGQHHVFHLHGGGDRWRYQPDTDDTQFDDGQIKSGNVVQSA
ncbi:MAG TPA: hypothetical protein VGR28_06115, partial [Candidatus Thermoplasmatota archaeon]|nr:hypothetical protein [Candidatus Thermoplasmatota archaeon]